MSAGPNPVAAGAVLDAPNSAGAAPGEALAGRPVAIVTGASRGIGRATALKLAVLGHAVVVNYAANEEAARLVVAEIETAGGVAVAVKGDVGVEPEVKGLFELADTLGRLTVLVNNAGVVDLKARVDEMSVERLTRMFTVNILGSFLCAREAVKRMSIRHGGEGGSIVNVSSVAAELGSPGLFVDYAASKGAINSFTIGLGREVAAEGIRVNAVSPGMIDTDIHASAGLPDRIAQLRDGIPIKREGTADEVANAIVWLCSDAASYVTGSVITVSGGR